jgi:hypothetical protein
VSSWSWSLVALGIAGFALLVSIASWLYFRRGLRLERERRAKRMNEAVFNWAGNVATKAELSELRDSVLELSDLKESMSNSDLRNAVAELSDRLTSLEAEARSLAEEKHASGFIRLPRR